MITSPRPNYFVSTDGYAIEVLGMTGLRYSEGDRQMFIDSEVVNGPSGIGLYQQTIQKWDPPHDEELVTETDRSRIVDNIRVVFKWQGYEIDVI
jgi:hypothetical protein